MRGLGGFLQETHRRAVWQVLGTYVAGAWVVLQVIEVLMETIGLPDWVPRFALVLLLIGLPIVTATAVIQGAARTRRDRAAMANEGGEPAAGGADDATPSGPASDTGSAGSPEASTSPGLFTWRNVAFGGLAAFALLGVMTAGWMAMRALGIGPVGSLVASGVIEEGERIVLAELDGDPELATGATLALRVDLEESGIVSLMDPAYVSAVLRLMQRPSDTPLDAALAREVAVRSGTKAVLEGEITPLGASHVLNVRLVAAETGQQLASFSETAGGDDELLGAIDRLSRKLRERLGESLRSIHASEPLEDVTTGSLEALRKYSQGVAAVDAGNDATAIRLLEEAVALDSTFGMAWRKLATVTFGDRRVRAATRAYELRDRLTDRERYHTLGIYHTDVTHDYDEAVVAYRTLLEAYPDDAVALNNLGVTYVSLGERRLAAEQYQRAMTLDPLVATYPQNLVMNLYSIGLTDSAGVVLDRYAANLPDHPELPDLVFRYATAEGEYERAHAALALRLESEDPGRRRFARLGEGWLTLLEGDLAGAERIWDQLSVDDEPNERLLRAVERAIELELRVLGDTAAAVRSGLAVLERHDIRELPMGAWPMEELLFLFGEAGRPDLIRPLAGEWLDWLADTGAPNGEVLARVIPMYLDAQETLHGADTSGGPELMRRALVDANASGQCDSLCFTLWLGTSHDLAQQADSAIAWYERYLETPALDRLDEDAQNLHRVLLRLGQLNDELGRYEDARRYYGRFEQLWAESDPRLMDRVESVRRRLGELIETPTTG